jgi:ATP-binding dynein motor region
MRLLLPSVQTFVQELVHDVLYADLIKRSVPITQPCDLTALLTTDATVQSWTAKGLPADAHSVQNGILTTRASRFPLCIDPQQQVHFIALLTQHFEVLVMQAAAQRTGAAFDCETAVRCSPYQQAATQRCKQPLR